MRPWAKRTQRSIKALNVQHENYFTLLYHERIGDRNCEDEPGLPVFGRQPGISCNPPNYLSATCIHLIPLLASTSPGKN